MMFEFLSFRQAAYHLYGKAFTELLARTSLTQNEVDILLFLANNPQHDTAAAIVRLRGLTKSHVSASVEHLTARGFLAQTADKNNRRIRHLTITDDAAPLIEEGRACQARFSRLLLAGISEDERVILSHCMEIMTENARGAAGKENL